jgi:hypothetical protein
VQDERVNVRAKLHDHERHAVRHQAANEMHIAAEAIQLSHGHRAPLTARLTQCGSKLWAPLDCVSALACLDFDEHAAQREALSGCEADKPSEVQRIIKDDGYRLLSREEEPKTGDIAIYREDGDIVHSGIVVGSMDQVPWVLGNCPYKSAVVEFYRLMK